MQYVNLNGRFFRLLLFVISIFTYIIIFTHNFQKRTKVLLADVIYLVCLEVQ